MHTNKPSYGRGMCKCDTGRTTANKLVYKCIQKFLRCYERIENWPIGLCSVYIPTLWWCIITGPYNPIGKSTWSRLLVSMWHVCIKLYMHFSELLTNTVQNYPPVIYVIISTKCASATNILSIQNKGRKINKSFF